MTSISEEIPGINFRMSIQTYWYGIGGVLAVALIVLLLVSNFSLRGSINNQLEELNSLSSQIATQSKSIESLRNQFENSKSGLNRLTDLVGSQSEIMSFMENPSVVVINLVNLQSEPTTRGRVLWNTEDNQAFFYGVNLPKTPVGKTYQLWAIADDGPVSIGVFNVDDKGKRIMKLGTLPDAGRIEKFAVTLEPVGGVPQPTGEMYLIGDS